MNDAGERGFTLLEMVCVLAIIALLAAVLLPFAPHETSRSRLQAYALQTAALQFGLERAQAIAAALNVAGVPPTAIRLHAEAAGRGGWARLVD